jgi:hypothetical protein
LMNATLMNAFIMNATGRIVIVLESKLELPSASQRMCIDRNVERAVEFT